MIYQSEEDSTYLGRGKGGRDRYMVEGVGCVDGISENIGKHEDKRNMTDGWGSKWRG